MKEMRKPSPSPAGDPDTRKPSDSTLRRERAPTAVTRRAPAPFRSRLFAMLLLFALIPTVAVTLLWTGAASRALSLMSAGSAWERVARSGEAALAAARSTSLTPAQQAALTAHETELRQSVELAKRFDFVAGRTVRLVVIGALLLVVAVAVGASRVAGHLSRQLSRPLDELVGWTRLIRSGQPIPEVTERRGAPEFEVMRSSMRTMALELDAGRRRALEAERAEAFRESARRFAHELKNPLTPIRFAIARLRRSAPDDLTDSVDVLAEESERLETMARNFAQFGRLPDGPAAEIDVAELVTKVVRSTVPEHIETELRIEPSLPMITGFHEPLVRALTNVLLNAIDACAGTGRLSIRVQRDLRPPVAHLVIAVRDTGPGIPPDVLRRIFEPYVTTKPGGTGLGLAIARQTMAAHHGEIVAYSTVGEGTDMHLRIPLPTGEKA